MEMIPNLLCINVIFTSNSVMMGIAWQLIFISNISLRVLTLKHAFLGVLVVFLLFFIDLVTISVIS